MRGIGIGYPPNLQITWTGIPIGLSSVCRGWQKVNGLELDEQINGAAPSGGWWCDRDGGGGAAVVVRRALTNYIRNIRANYINGTEFTLPPQSHCCCPSSSSCSPAGWIFYVSAPPRPIVVVVSSGAESSNELEYVYVNVQYGGLGVCLVWDGD